MQNQTYFITTCRRKSTETEKKNPENVAGEKFP
jgi:hypothetical protein